MQLQKPEKRRQQQRLHRAAPAVENQHATAKTSSGNKCQLFSCCSHFDLATHLPTLFFSHFMPETRLLFRIPQSAIVSLVNNVIFSVKFHSIGQGIWLSGHNPCQPLPYHSYQLIRRPLVGNLCVRKSVRPHKKMSSCLFVSICPFLWQHFEQVKCFLCIYCSRICCLFLRKIAFN